MTKKILALALAGTTAFSVFGSVLTASAAYSDAYKAYASPTISQLDAATDGGTMKVTIPGSPDVIKTFAVTTLNGYNTKAQFADMYGVFSMVALNSENAPVSAGTIITEKHIYLYDYVLLDGKAAKDYAATIASFLTAYEQAPDSGTLTGTTLQNAAKKIITDFDDYYDLNGTTPKIMDNTTGATNTSRMGIYNNYQKTFDAAGDLAKADYNEVDWESTGYDMAALKAAIAAINKSAAQGKRSSELVYLTQTYDRIVAAMNASDPDNLIAEYEREMAKLSARTADDYASTAKWIDFRAYLDKAADEAAKGTYAGYSAAIDYLDKARSLSVVKPDVTQLGTLLESLFTDIPAGSTPAINNVTYPINGKVENFGTDYNTALAQAYAAYPASDYYRYNYTLYRPLAVAYSEAFINDASNYYESAYTEAMTAYADVKTHTFSYTTSKSDVARAYERLTEAIDALGAVNGPSTWDQMKLEAFVDLVSGFDSEDFYTNRTQYKTFMTYYDSAEKILAKANPSKTETENIIKKLEDSFAPFMATRKPVAYALKKELSASLKVADDHLSAITNETGAQYVALSKAIDEASDVLNETIKTSVSKTGTRLSTTTDFNNAIAALEAAINSYSQTQGWYEEGGKWMYGEGDGVLTNGWNKIGNFWFFFNEDGTAKQNEWFENGGSWYYCGNSCVAYSGWGKVDGSWYYFGKDCAMKTGWVRPANSYYYLDPTSGKMVTGWATIGGKSYYFSTDSATLGAMLVSTTTPDGYEVGADGAWIQK